MARHLHRGLGRGARRGRGGRHGEFRRRACGGGRGGGAAEQQHRRDEAPDPHQGADLDGSVVAPVRGHERHRDAAAGLAPDGDDAAPRLHCVTRRAEAQVRRRRDERVTSPVSPKTSPRGLRDLHRSARAAPRPRAAPRRPTGGPDAADARASRPRARRRSSAAIAQRIERLARSGGRRDHDVVDAGHAVGDCAAGGWSPSSPGSTCSASRRHRATGRDRARPADHQQRVPVRSSPGAGGPGRARTRRRRRARRRRRRTSNPSRGHSAGSSAISRPASAGSPPRVTCARRRGCPCHPAAASRPPGSRSRHGPRGAAAQRRGRAGRAALPRPGRPRRRGRGTVLLARSRASAVAGTVVLTVVLAGTEGRARGDRARLDTPRRRSRRRGTASARRLQAPHRAAAVSLRPAAGVSDAARPEDAASASTTAARERRSSPRCAAPGPRWRSHRRSRRRHVHAAEPRAGRRSTTLTSAARRSSELPRGQRHRVVASRSAASVRRRRSISGASRTSWRLEHAAAQRARQRRWSFVRLDRACLAAPGKAIGTGYALTTPDDG